MTSERAPLVCPSCGSAAVYTERRPNGDHYCDACLFRWKNVSPPRPPKPRRFTLQRSEDVSGVSGTGTVAEGVLFSNGVAVLQWTSEFPTSVVFHERGMESIEAVHGHSGRTRVVWIDLP